MAAAAMYEGVQPLSPQPSPHRMAAKAALALAGFDDGDSDVDGGEGGDHGTGSAHAGDDDMFRPALLTQMPDSDGRGGELDGDEDDVVAPSRHQLQLPPPSHQHSTAAAAAASAASLVATSLLDIDLSEECVPTPGKGDKRTVDEINRQEAQRRAKQAAAAASVPATAAAAKPPSGRAPPAARPPPARHAAAPAPPPAPPTSSWDSDGSQSQLQASAAPPQRANKRLHKAADAPLAAPQRAAPAAAPAAAGAAAAAAVPSAAKKTQAKAPPPPPRVPVAVVGVGVLQTGPPFELPPCYDLHSVIRHEGSRAYAGHYTADVRRAPAPSTPASATHYHTPATAAATEVLLREAALLGLCRLCDGLHVPSDGHCSDCTARAAALRAAAGTLPAGSGRAAKRQRAAPAHAAQAATARAAHGSDWEWDRHDDSSIRRLTTAQVTGDNGQQQAYVLIYVLDESRAQVPAGGTAATATSSQR